MRTTPRPRRPISRLSFVLLRPIVRYSRSREAYILRMIGNNHGCVFVRRDNSNAHRSEQPRRGSA